MTKDLYEVLGLERSASEDEIKKAYRKLARENHPDRNPGDKAAEQRFKDIQQAYSVLGNKEKKQQYDKYGFVGDGFGQQGSAGPEGFTFRWGGGESGQFNTDDIPEDLFNIFGNMGGMGGDPFGGARASRRRRPQRPQETTANVTIPFETAANGGPVDLQVDNREITVKIPPGAEEGQTMRLRGQAPGGGDLLLKLNIEPHRYYQREGNDIILEVPISAAEAILGTKVEVPTLDGSRLNVKVPAGTSSGSRLRLRGKGVKGGDQYIEIKVVAKAPSDERSRELIEEYAKLNENDPRKGLPWS